MHAPTSYSAVFLLHAPAPAPIKIGFSAVKCGAVLCGSCGCVGEAYTPTNHYAKFKYILTVANMSI